MRLAQIAVFVVVIAPSCAAQSTDLEAVRWLASCWEMSAGTRRVVERWTPPENGEMHGVSRTWIGGREVESERLRIYRQGDTLVYDARPSSQTPTQFRGIARIAGEIVFENPAHDFPQRISYRKVGSDSLVARVEGDRDGKRRPLVFAYRRIDCAAQPE